METPKIEAEENKSTKLESSKLVPKSEPNSSKNIVKNSPSQKSEDGKSDTKKEETDLTQESYYLLEDITKEGLQKFLKEAMLVFNERYSIADK